MTWDRCGSARRAEISLGRGPPGGTLTRMAIRTAVWIAIAIASLAGVAAAARRDWTGSAACGACHPGELAAWQVTPHARTRDRFGPSRADRFRSAAKQGSGSPYGEGPPLGESPCG